MSFFHELKRRNVFRMAILYVVTGWLVLQVSDVLFDALELPPQWTRLVVAMLALGFPLALVFSWIFEITPAGVERDSGASVGRRHRMDMAIVALLALAVAVLLLDRFLASSDRVPVPVAQNSIAVLPFADLSEGRDHQYFTDGLSEELLNVLVSVGGLRVASRTSSFAYRDSTIGVPAIAKALNVAYIVEGSVRKDGDQIRITAQLIETETDRHIWSANYDENFDEIFSIQDQIANAIAGALARELDLSDLGSVRVDAVTQNLDAYQVYLEARELFVRRIRLGESISKYHAAIELDPGFARAWEGLAAVEAIADDWLWGPREDGIDHAPLAEEAAKRALELNPDLSMPLAVLGQLAARTHRDPVGGLAYIDAAIQKDPKNISAWQWKGTMLKYAGYLDEAIYALEQCLEIDPTSAICRDYLAETYLYRGDTELALKLHEESIADLFFATGPSFVSTYVRRNERNLALLIARNKMGDTDAPVIEWIRAIENPGVDHSAGLARLNDWVKQNDFEMGLPPQLLFTFGAHEQMLEIGEMQRRMLFHPDAVEFRHSPQFKEVVRLWGFDRLWRERGFPARCRPVGVDDFECG